MYVAGEMSCQADGLVPVLGGVTENCYYPHHKRDIIAYS